MIANVAREDVAVATGILFLFRTTGQVLGVSLSGAILQAVLTTQLRKRITGPGAFEVRPSPSFRPPACFAHLRASSVQIIERIKHSTAIIPELPTPLREAAVNSYADGLRVVFICQVVWAVLAFMCCLRIEERPLPCVCHLFGSRVDGRSLVLLVSRATMEEQERLYRDRQNERNQNP